MRPPNFDYFAARDVEHAVELLTQHGADAKVIAGGQSLVPMMKLRLMRPVCLIDINGIAALSGVSLVAGGFLIGALTRHRDVASSTLLASVLPILPVAAAEVGNPAVRNRGTLGGSLVHADPAAELPVVSLALDAEAVLRGPRGERRVPMSSFFLDFMMTAAEPDELFVGLFAPTWPPGTAWAFEELRRRPVDFAIVAVAVVLRLDAAGAVTHARVGVGGAAYTPVRATAAEQALLGQVPSSAVFDAAAAAARAEVAPFDDAHATAEFRREMVGVLTRRALASAIARAGGAA